MKKTSLFLLVSFGIFILLFAGLQLGFSARAEEQEPCKSRLTRWLLLAWITLSW